MDLLTIGISAGVGAVVGLLTHWFSAWISNRYWRQQELWRLRGQAYRELYAAVSDLRRFIAAPPQPGAGVDQQLGDRAGAFFAASEYARLFMCTDGVKALDHP